MVVEYKRTPMAEQRRIMHEYLTHKKRWPADRAINHCATLSDERVHKFYKALVALGEVQPPE